MGLLRWVRRRREARRAAVAAEAAVAAAAFEQFRAYAASRGAHVILVDRVYQHARRGTKAVVYELNGRNVPQEAWFWWAPVRNGDVLMVSASTGYGPHTGRNDVLYVGSAGGPGVLSRFDSKLFAAARRHWTSHQMATR